MDGECHSWIFPTPASVSASATVFVFFALDAATSAFPKAMMAKKINEWTWRHVATKDVYMQSLYIFLNEYNPRARWT